MKRRNDCVGRPPVARKKRPSSRATQYIDSVGTARPARLRAASSRTADQGEPSLYATASMRSGKGPASRHSGTRRSSRPKTTSGTFESPSFWSSAGLGNECPPPDFPPRAADEWGPPLAHATAAAAPSAANRRSVLGPRVTSLPVYSRRLREWRGFRGRPDGGGDPRRRLPAGGIRRSPGAPHHGAPAGSVRSSRCWLAAGSRASGRQEEPL